MAAPSPPSPPKGKDIGIAPFPPPNNLIHANANNTNFARNQGATATYCREVGLKLDFENSGIDTDTNIAKDPANQAVPNQDPDADGDADGDEDDMPRPRPQPVKREADIHIILTAPQRLDFNKLSEEILNKVYEQVAKATKFLDHPKAQVGRVQIWNYAPAVKAAREAQEAEKDDIYSVDPKPGEVQSEAVKVEPNPIRIDVSTVRPTVSSMSVLKSESEAYFAKWKSTFNKRFADLIVVNQPNFGAGLPRQGQGVPRGGAMAGGRPQQQGTFPNCPQPEVPLKLDAF